MKCDTMGLLYQSAMGLRRSDPVLAFSLLELANNLRLVIRGEETLEAWQAVYVGFDREPLDIDALMPGLAV